MINDVLLKPDEYYNAFVGGKIHRKHVLKKKWKKDKLGVDFLVLIW